MTGRALLREQPFARSVDYLVMFRHPVIGEWRVWGPALTEAMATQRMKDAHAEQPEYGFRLARRETVIDWLPSGTEYPASSTPAGGDRSLLAGRDVAAVRIAWDELVSYIETTGDEGSLDDEEMPDGKLRWAANTLRALLLAAGEDV